MEQKEISIHEALPILKEVLNMSGIAKLMGKSTSWFTSKVSEKTILARLEPGFTEANIRLIT